MIKVSNLVKKYGDFEVLKGISFEVKKGTVSGFLGRNGAGKSTTMNILTGLIGYNGGKITIDGKNLKSHKSEIIKKVGYLPEDSVFYGYMNAYEYLNFIGDISKYPKSKLKMRIDELLDTAKLKSAAKRKVGGYSRGMKQRLGLIVAMFNEPEILFLDEPTLALDPQGRKDMMELIGNFKTQNITVFLSTHILSDVERVCDEVNILDHGEIILSQNLEELKNSYIQPVYDMEFEYECGEIGNNLLRYECIVLGVGILVFAILDPIMLKLLPIFLKGQVVKGVDLSTVFLVTQKMALQNYIKDLFQIGNLFITLSMIIIFSALFVSLYYTFNISLIVFFSSLFKKSIAAGIIVLVISYFMPLGLNIKVLANYIPYRLVSEAYLFGSVSGDIWITILFVALLAILLNIAAMWRMNKVEVI